MNLSKSLFFAPFLLIKAAIAGPVDLSTMQLNDGAFINPAGELVLSLNAGLPNDGVVPGATSAFITTPFAISSSSTFQATFQFRQDGTADGLTFIVHNDPRGASAIGAGGSSMGVDGGPGNNPAAISPSYAVEFDLFGGLPHPFNEIAIVKDGNANENEEIAEAISPVPLGTGQTFTAWVEHDGQTLSAFINNSNVKPAAPTIAALLPLFDLGPSVYFGFTGARGGFGSDQFIESFDLTVNGPVATVPLPFSFPLLAFGCGMLGFLGWKRKRAVAA